MPRNNHVELENSQIHPPKDFSVAASGDVMRKNLNDELTWGNNYWKPPVLDLADINATPPSENDGDRYIVIEVASTVADAAWDGAAVDQIVEYSSTSGVWAAKTPTEGDVLHDNDSDNYYKYNGTAWEVLISPGGADFSNGGEAEGADRTLGNTDNYDLGFLTNNTVRLHLQNDGNVGIGTTTPSALLHVNGGASIGEQYLGSTIKANGSEISSLNFIGNDASDNETIYAQIVSEIDDNTANDELGELVFKAQTGGGVLFERLRLDEDGRAIFGSSGLSDASLQVKDTNGNVAVKLNPNAFPNGLIGSAENEDVGFRWELSSTSTGIQFDWFIDYSTNEFILQDNNEGELMAFNWDDATVYITSAPTFANEAEFLSNVTIDLNSVLRIPAKTNVADINAVGEMALDTDGDGSTITTGVLTMHDGTQNLYGVATTNYPSSDNDVPAYDSATNSVTWQPQAGGGSSGLPSGYIYNLKISYVSATTIQISTGCCRNAADDYDIELTGTQNVALTTSGANGLDTGAEGSSTLYYVWVIEKSSDGTTGGLLSLSDSAPTMPSGYDKKRLIGAIYNDSSSDIMVFQSRGKGNTRYMFLDDDVTPLILLNGGSATTFTNVDVSSLVPSISQNIFVRCSFQRTSFGNIDDAFYVRPDGSSSTTPASRVGGMFDDTDPNAFTRVLFPIELSSSQIFEYAVADVDNDLSLFLISYQFEL